MLALERKSHFLLLLGTIAAGWLARQSSLASSRLLAAAPKNANSLTTRRQTGMIFAKIKRFFAPERGILRKLSTKFSDLRQYTTPRKMTRSNAIFFQFSATHAKREEKLFLGQLIFCNRDESFGRPSCAKVVCLATKMMPPVRWSGRKTLLWHGSEKQTKISWKRVCVKSVTQNSN